MLLVLHWRFASRARFLSLFRVSGSLHSVTLIGSFLVIIKVGVVSRYERLSPEIASGFTNKAITITLLLCVELVQNVLEVIAF